MTKTKMERQDVLSLVDKIIFVLCATTIAFSLSCSESGDSDRIRYLENVGDSVIDLIRQSQKGDGRYPSTLREVDGVLKLLKPTEKMCTWKYKGDNTGFYLHFYLPDDSNIYYYRGSRDSQWTRGGEF